MTKTFQNSVSTVNWIMQFLKTDVSEHKPDKQLSLMPSKSSSVALSWAVKKKKSAEHIAFHSCTDSDPEFQGRVYMQAWDTEHTTLCPSPTPTGLYPCPEEVFASQVAGRPDLRNTRVKAD